MKIDLIKTANGKLWAANEDAEEYITKLKTGEHYTADIKLDQNYKLLQKVHVFFKHCAKYYFGDEEVDKHQVAYTKRQLLIAAGYTRTMVDPRSGYIEVIPKSISYAKMTEEQRRDCYSKLVTAACKNVFHSADVEVWNDLMRFF